ncbi:origin recognition complex subunit 4 [Purpureocillium lavendulum]|uniref:Origin recognition complex subunit 4 n=1 Tax=Purpureocillium lavendulum TaxID=1247861 RepID=A0AB34GAF5_9HYPO|nr:origin recognition complex subunit 4 [Purpureocillium lavendulum]
MNFGIAWEDWLGRCDQATAESILDLFYEQGGVYQFGDSELWVGEWMRKRSNRDQMVIATKYTSNFSAGHEHPSIVMSSFTGNGTKSLINSLKSSLERLQTDYIDLLYVHFWDYSTSIAELMQSLNQLVTSGKVLYLGVSDTPAWVVSKANEYARCHGLRQFSVYQGLWNASSREFEREIIPMCRSEGMAICPWGAVGGGKFKTEQQRQRARGHVTRYSETDVKVSLVLESVADRVKSTVTGVALAYVMHKAPYVFPIVGGRTIEHLMANVAALTIRLSGADIKMIESASPLDWGFPHNLLWEGGVGPVGDSYQNVWLLGTGGNFRYVEEPKKSAPCLAFWAFETVRGVAPEVVPAVALAGDIASAAQHVPMTPEDEFRYISVIPETQLVEEQVTPLSDPNPESDRHSRSSVGSDHFEDSNPRNEEHDCTSTIPSDAAKGLREVPRSAPRSIQRIGKYNFRQGVRISDYKVPRRRRSASPVAGMTYQGRDGFEESEISSGSPQPMPRRHQRQVPELSPVPLDLFDSSPISPTSNADSEDRRRRSRLASLSPAVAEAMNNTHSRVKEPQRCSPQSAEYTIESAGADEGQSRRRTA